MPNSANAKRSLRKKEVRRERNTSQRSALKTFVKKVRTNASAAKVEDAQSALQVAIKKLDQAADKHLIHKNKAARLKSRLAKQVNKAAAAPAPAATPAP